MTTPTTGAWVRRLGTAAITPDNLVVEEPLALRLAVGDEVRRLATTMRTPGHDLELAVGWMVAEGLIRRRSDILDVSRCARWEHDTPPPNSSREEQTGTLFARRAEHDALRAKSKADGSSREEMGRHAGHDHGNLATVTLRGVGVPALGHLDRHGVVTSACGICGRASIDALVATGVAPVPDDDRRLSTRVLGTLPAVMREHQTVFDATGGAHAAARFTFDGELLAVREDVGRHNALDKLVGAAMLDGDLPLRDEVLVVSSRASYELVVKAAVAGAPVLASVGAATSLAVDVAHEFGVTLVSFLRDGGGTVLTNDQRLTDLEVRR